MRIAALTVLLSLAALAQDLASKADEYIEAHKKNGQFQGSVLVAKDGKVLVSKGYGMANIEHDIANTPDTKFRLGSITKQFTAMAILQLAERGKLTLEDTARKYVPDAHQDWEKVRVRHLLTHSSGIPSFTSFPDYGKFKWQPAKAAEILARFKDKALEFEPGDQFRYNNSGYYLLGYIVEKASGKSYEAYVGENIFAPLGMKDSGYDSLAIIKNRASGYSPSPNGPRNTDFIHMTIPGGAGALYSTVQDLYKWDQALYTDKLVSKAMIEAMFRPNKGDYGYGWMIKPHLNRTRIAHGGGIEGFNTMISRYPAEKLVVVVLSNINTSATGRMADDLAAMALGESYQIPKMRTAIQLEPKALAAYPGKYELSPQFALTITLEDGRLMSQATNQPKVEVFAEAADKFFLKVVDAQLTFSRDEAGKVKGLTLHQNGRDMPGKRVE